MIKEVAKIDREGNTLNITTVCGSEFQLPSYTDVEIGDFYAEKTEEVIKRKGFMSRVGI